MFPNNHNPGDKRAAGKKPCRSPFAQIRVDVLPQTLQLIQKFVRWGARRWFFMELLKATMEAVMLDPSIVTKVVDRKGKLKVIVVDKQQGD